MTDLTSEQVVERCRTYWLESGVDRDQVADMSIELRSHLQDAMANGKSIESVVGSDTDRFADEWAAASRGLKPGTAATSDATAPDRSQGNYAGLWLGAAGIAVLVAAVALFVPDDPDMEVSTWATVWIVAAGVLAVGELLTAGFFLLPFAVAAGAAGLLALAEVSVTVQIIVFVIVSIAFLWLLQRFAVKDVRGELLPVGAARYIGSTAVVTSPVDRLSGEGRVMMGTEDWRATTDGSATIGKGTEVRVTEVRGARLVVEPAD